MKNLRLHCTFGEDLFRKIKVKFLSNKQKLIIIPGSWKWNEQTRNRNWDPEKDSKGKIINI